MRRWVLGALLWPVLACQTPDGGQLAGNETTAPPHEDAAGADVAVGGRDADPLDDGYASAPTDLGDPSTGDSDTPVGGHDDSGAFDVTAPDDGYVATEDTATEDTATEDTATEDTADDDAGAEADALSADDAGLDDAESGGPDGIGESDAESGGPDVAVPPAAGTCADPVVAAGLPLTWSGDLATQGDTVTVLNTGCPGAKPGGPDEVLTVKVAKGTDINLSLTASEPTRISLVKACDGVVESCTAGKATQGPTDPVEFKATLSAGVVYYLIVEGAGTFTVTVDRDDCAGSPCPTDALCVDGFGTYSCDCLDGGTFVAGACVPPPAWFVDPGAPLGGDGTRWEGAFPTLPAAFSAAKWTPGRPIWVKAGTLPPTTVPPGMLLYGGFSPALTGQTGDLEARSPDQRTVLDGGGSATVVTLGAGTRLDGFVVRNGAATDFGAGVRVIEADGVVLANVTIEDNAVKATTAATARGGGLYCTDATGLQLVDVDLVGNAARGKDGFQAGDGAGGGAWLGGCTAHFDHVVFSNNLAEGGAPDSGGLVLPGRAGSGGGLYAHNAALLWDEVRFVGNEARGSQGHPGTGLSANTGAQGGPGQGGAAWLGEGSSVTWAAGVAEDNQAHGGMGGKGGDGVSAVTFCGDGGTGGAGGNGAGGALFIVATVALSADAVTVAGNSAVPGPAGLGGPAGKDEECAFPPAPCQVCQPGVAGTLGQAGGGGLRAEGSLVTGLDLSDNAPDDTWGP